MSNEQFTIAALCLSSGALILAAGAVHLACRRSRQMKVMNAQAFAPIDALKSDLIQAALVIRDETGCWWHPDMPDFDEGDGDKYEAWLQSQGLETAHARLEDEPDEHPVAKAYFEDGECDFRAWIPSPPDGDGWFVLAIGDTEDGPLWCWARHKEGATL